MKNFALGIAAAVLGATTLLAQAQSAPPAQPQDKPADVTVTGCLLQGSGPTVFILDNAKKNPDDANEKAQKYVITVASENVALKTHLNHEVRVVGVAEVKTPPAAQTVAEKDLPKFTAKTVTMVADRCSPASR